MTHEDEEIKDLKNFIENYEEFLEDLLDYISAGAITKDDLQSLKESRDQNIYWDYFLIDESQDWQVKEKEILYKLFGHSSIIIAEVYNVKNKKINYIKINIYPDGGISRIRAYGRAE